MTMTGKERAALRSECNRLKTTVHIGHAGADDAAVRSLDDVLRTILEILARQPEVGLARVWLAETGASCPLCRDRTGERALHLRASAGAPLAALPGTLATVTVWPLAAARVTTKFAFTEPASPSVTLTALAIETFGTGSSLVIVTVAGFTLMAP